MEVDWRIFLFVWWAAGGRPLLPSFLCEGIAPGGRSLGLCPSWGRRKETMINSEQQRARSDRSRGRC